MSRPETGVRGTHLGPWGPLGPNNRRRRARHHPRGCTWAVFLTSLFYGDIKPQRVAGLSLNPVEPRVQILDRNLY